MTTLKSKERGKREPGGWWSEWMDQCGVELLGQCGDNCSVGRNSVAALPDKASPPAVDYVALHDEFLESLLHEQMKIDPDDSGENGSLTIQSSMSMCSSTSVETETTCSTASSRKRRRPIRLQRRNSPARLQKSGSGGKEAPSQPVPDSTSNRVSSLPVPLTELSSMSNVRSPETYLHPQCRMQKDKGKGEPVGSSICAKGADACLEKLRAKMSLLTNHALDPKAPATMKRRKARLAARYQNFVETRSVFELRMGFLSMNYGILFRWDTGHTGKITLVVLRKQCTDSFYPKVKAEIPVFRETHERQGSSLVDVVKDNHTIQSRPGGTEVTLLDPPYRVQRPDEFPPSVLKVTVLYAKGLSKKSSWTAQIKYEDHVENIGLANDACGLFIPKLEDELTCQLTDVFLSVVEIRLYEHRMRRRNQRRLMGTMKIPLGSLKPQPNDAPKPSRLQVSCNHDPDSFIFIQLDYQSDYAIWLAKEVEARRNEEAASFWTAPFALAEELVSNDENKAPWDWICSVC